MKYKVGDRVFIRPDLKGNNRYGKYVFISYYENTLKYTDRLVTIIEVHDCSYTVGHPLIKEELYFITDEMIAGYGFEWGEDVYISDDGVPNPKKSGIIKRQYIGHWYKENIIYQVNYHGTTGHWRYAVSVPPAPKTVTITLTEAQLEEVKKIIKI